MDARQFTSGKGCRNRKLSDEDRAEIVRLYTAPLPDGTWMGSTAIAKRFGVAHSCIQDRLKRAGVVLRSKKEANAGKRCKPIKNLPVGDAPPCKCGCQEQTAWNQRRNRWNAYVAGHYRLAKLYWDEGWLREQYVTRSRTIADIARECGVGESAVAKFMRKLDIPARNGSASHIGRQSGANNPAWKGGVADWDYSPEWKRIARQIRFRDKWTCGLCHLQRSNWGKRLHVHHIDGDKLNNDPLNLISVCAECHPRGKREHELAPALRALAARAEVVI